MRTWGVEEKKQDNKSDLENMKYSKGGCKLLSADESQRHCTYFSEWIDLLCEDKKGRVEAK